MAAFRLQANKDQVDTSKQTKVEFGKDVDLYRTSPMVAYTTVPLWLQSTQQDLWEYSGADNGISVKESSNKSEPTTCSIGVHTTSNNRKMYWCRLCNYASFEKSTIMRHQRTHTGLRPYSCTVCKLAFTTKANCERHVRKRHDIKHNTDIKELVFCDHDLLRKARIGNLSNGDEVLKVIPPSSGKYLSFQCRLCKSAFSSRSNGARHVMTKHGIINRKGANEVIMCVKVNKSPQQPETHG
uniref:C2H2-type domain-containing protein n=1 Tax=Ciona savignyi TaxID=51511 RepID=H2Z6G3_CIOSA